MKAYTTRVGEGPFPTELLTKLEKLYLPVEMNLVQQPEEQEGVDGLTYTLKKLLKQMALMEYVLQS